MIYTKQFKDFLLILGEKSVDVFNYFKVDEMHGLTKKDALKHKENSQQAYIYGLSNYIPKKSGNYKDGDPGFVFLNLNRMNGTYKDYLGIMHEAVHISLLINNWDIENKEEEIVTNAEKYAEDIIQYMETIKNESWFGNL